MLEPQSVDIKSETDGISFFNRDHIISVVVHHGEIVVTTTGADKIRISVSRTALEKFVDDLANHVESNFVSIATTPSPTAVPG